MVEISIIVGEFQWVMYLCFEVGGIYICVLGPKRLCNYGLWGS
jgi:hypothetical protein